MIFSLVVSLYKNSFHLKKNNKKNNCYYLCKSANFAMAVLFTCCGLLIVLTENMQDGMLFFLSQTN